MIQFFVLSVFLISSVAFAEDGSYTFTKSTDLKSNDVVKQMNGQDVSSPAQAMEMYNSLKTTGNGTVTVERGPSSNARCVPNMAPNTNGQINGYRCMEINGGMAKAGIREGDVITVIDNENLKSGEDAMRLLKLVEQNKHHRLHVIRDGREEVLRR